MRDTLEELTKIRFPGSVIMLGVSNEESSTGKIVPHNVVLFGLTDENHPKDPKVFDLRKAPYRYFNGKKLVNAVRYEFYVESIDSGDSYPFLAIQPDAGFVVSNSGYTNLLSHFLPIKSPRHIFIPLGGDSINEYLGHQRPIVVGCMIRNPILDNPGLLDIVTPSGDDTYVESFRIPNIEGYGKIIVTPKSCNNRLFQVGDSPTIVELHKPIEELAGDLFNALHGSTNYRVGVVGLAHNPYTEEIFGIKIDDLGKEIQHPQVDQAAGFDR